MTDVVAIQHGLFHGLRSCSLFNDVNVVLGRNLAIDSEAAMDAIWMTPAPSGKSGVGLIVQIPELIVSKPNSRSREREFSIGIYEERNVNFTPGTGTLVTAEDWSDLVVDFLLNWQLWRSGGLIPVERAVVADDRLPGVVGLRAACRLSQVRVQSARASTPIITVGVGNSVTITAGAGESIYYTRDGVSAPMPDNTGSLSGENASVLYSGAFTATAGDTVLAMAFIAGKHPSQIAVQAIT